MHNVMEISHQHQDNYRIQAIIIGHQVSQDFALAVKDKKMVLEVCDMSSVCAIVF